MPPIIVFLQKSWPTRTPLISQSSHLTVMTMGLSLWGWIPVACFSKNEIMDYGDWHLPSVSTSGRFYTLKIWRVYILQEELASPPPANPHDMVLSVWNTTLPPSPWGASLALLGMGLLLSSRPRKLDLLTNWRSHLSHISWGVPPVLVSWFPFWAESSH